MPEVTFFDRFKLKFDWEEGRRIIAGKEVIVHCHHYNARLQNIIESIDQIDGKAIIISSAELVFFEMFNNIVEESDSESDKWQLATELFAHLGLGLLDLSEIGAGVIQVPSSHSVEGWVSAFSYMEKAVCSITSGYLQGVIYAITGKAVYAHEIECRSSGAAACIFNIDESRARAFTAAIEKQALAEISQLLGPENILTPPNVDEEKIISALIEMPIYGNDDGLIPAFGVYLANLPADFYNLIIIRFLEEMGKINLYSSAVRLVVFAGETCALNTFRGIMKSPEWDALIAPMIKEEEDTLFGLIAVSNALGWGRWHVSEYEFEVSLVLKTQNGYESEGFRQYRGQSSKPECYMLKGVAAGIMGLLHADGTVDEKIGTFYAEETQCLCNEGQLCEFTVEAV